MNRQITIVVDADEAAIILDALDTEWEIYRQSTGDAADDGNHILAAALGYATERIRACRLRVAEAACTTAPCN
ncbi:hypothetical protein [Sphingomonas solaris]|uniref:Uncharacterized protein n=1 Tax=Alterirhizorhabdus solaris TaxID=2529389 RepID=A0A558R7K6_9SPHN|nr:hypothetical protein [Sphingomonas solaris]TVV75379.1 hypothetical protein FOY91_07285 [Sphingomonas solaris]